MRRYLVAGNWKMNLTGETSVALAREIATAVPAPLPAVDVLVCPPFPYLATVATVVRGSGVSLGAQNAWHEPPGAFTGEVAAGMLLDVGCRSVILGHSERRHILHESDELINRKVHTMRQAGLQVILCVGEHLEERDTHRTEDVLNRQMTGGLQGIDAEKLGDTVIAYEPVWAIGTGKNATPAEADEAHRHIRGRLRQWFGGSAADACRILYGGSVKPENIRDLIGLPDVDGALVGGASLDPRTFGEIVTRATG
jgi:triosephosphate isomerase